MRTLIIHNPKSGFGSDAIFEFERALLSPGDKCDFLMTDEDFSASEVVSGAVDYDLVVVSGGDGTVASLLYALRGTGVPTCIFPSGTANLLYANLGNAPEPASLARACRIGETTPIDLGEISWFDERGLRSTRGFALMAGTGFDAQLMEAAIPNKATMGEAAYFAAALANPRPETIHYVINVDGERYERDGISCLVADNAMIQGDIEVVPDSRMDDGEIEVIVIETSDVVQVLHPLLVGLVDKTGNSLGRPHIECFRGQEVSVRTSKVIPLEIDGDSCSSGVGGYDAHVIPQAVDVIVDAMSRYHRKGFEPTPRFPVDDIPYPRF